MTSPERPVSPRSPPGSKTMPTRSWQNWLPATVRCADRSKPVPSRDRTRHSSRRRPGSSAAGQRVAQTKPAEQTRVRERPRRPNTPPTRRSRPAAAATAARRHARPAPGTAPRPSAPAAADPAGGKRDSRRYRARRKDAGPARRSIRRCLGGTNSRRRSTTDVSRFGSEPWPPPVSGKGSWAPSGSAHGTVA